MKTKEEILQHLQCTGYDDFSTAKILGFLLGNHTVEKGEEVVFNSGDRSFEDFFEWLNEEPKKNIFCEIAASLDYFLGFNEHKTPERVKKVTRRQIKFLMENKEYLQECMDKKDEAEAFLDDVTEVLSSINKTLGSFFKK